MSGALLLYRVGTALLEPLAPVLLQRRARAGKEDPARLGERLGRATIPRPAGRLVWLHGVSVGETLSLLPLAKALGEARPDLTLLITSGTRTSAELLSGRLPKAAIHQYAPIDGPGAVARFLDHWRPDLGLLVESELWPNLILAADRRGLPLALVSARMTQASADGWARARGAARRLLSAFRLILPQEPETAARLAGLGAAMGPELNLKQIGEPLPCDATELDRLKAAFGEAPVILAASTHPGEEVLIARAFRAAGRDARLVIAPRHPDRAEAICAELTAEGFKVARRSLGEAPGDGVYLADTLGEMGLFFRLARAVVMGGSFFEGIGGHNPLEPARLGVPIVTGPHVFNAQATYEAMFDEVASIPAVDEAALARHIAGLIDYPHIARRIGQAALAHAGRQGQALNRALDLILPLVPA